jgi:hypothetical protein
MSQAAHTYVSGRSYNQQLARTRRVLERLVQGQEVIGSKRMRPVHSFHSQINALRCGLNCNFYFILTDNTDNIGGFA